MHSPASLLSHHIIESTFVLSNSTELKPLSLSSHIGAISPSTMHHACMQIGISAKCHFERQLKPEKQKTHLEQRRWSVSSPFVHRIDRRKYIRRHWRENFDWWLCIINIAIGWSAVTSSSAAAAVAAAVAEAAEADFIHISRTYTHVMVAIVTSSLIVGKSTFKTLWPPLDSPPVWFCSNGLTCTGGRRARFCTNIEGNFM